MSNTNYTITEDRESHPKNELSNVNNESNTYNILKNYNNIFDKYNDFNSYNNDINLNSNLNNVNNAPLKYKRYNLYEIRKELGDEEKNNFNDFYEKNNNTNNNLLRFNSQRNIHYNDEFHTNLNNEIEKNRLKLENEKLLKENISLKKELNNALNNVKEQPLILNNSNNTNEQLCALQNKISIYEISLEKTKNKYEQQINYYIEQISKYNNLINVINIFFQNISKKYDLNLIIKEQNKDVPLNTKYLEEKFKQIELYISNMNNELNSYRIKNFDSSILNQNLNMNLMDRKTEVKEIKENKNMEEINDLNINMDNNNSYIKTNNAFNNNNIMFENEIIAKKVRANSSTRGKIRVSKKDTKKNNSFAKNKKNRNGINKKKDSKNKDNKNNLDIINYSKKSHKTFKKSVEIPKQERKRSKSKTKIKK